MTIDDFANIWCIIWIVNATACTLYMLIYIQIKDAGEDVEKVYNEALELMTNRIPIVRKVAKFVLWLEA